MSYKGSGSFKGVRGGSINVGCPRGSFTDKSK